MAREAVGGAVKDAVAVSPPVRVMVGPAVWVQAKARSLAAKAELSFLPLSVTMTPGRVWMSGPAFAIGVEVALAGVALGLGGCTWAGHVFAGVGAFAPESSYQTGFVV